MQQQATFFQRIPIAGGDYYTMYLSDVFIFESISAYFAVNLHTFEIKKIDKGKNISRTEHETSILNEFSITTPYQRRLKPQNINPDLLEPTIVLGYKCNYSCDYCYQKDQRKNQTDVMNSKDIAAILSFYEKYCQLYSLEEEYGDIGVIGGEPLLPQNEDVINAIGDTWKNSRLIITTNGTYIDYFSSFFRKYNTKVRVSLDGTKSTHYLRRKTQSEDAYERSIEGIKLLLNLGIEVVIISVFSKDLLRDASEFFNMLEEQLGWRRNPLISLAFIPEFGVGCDDIPIERIVDNLKNFHKLVNTDARALEVDSRKLFPGSITLKESIELARQGYYAPYRCSALYSSNFAFIPNGTVHTCLSAVNSSEQCIGRFKPAPYVNTEFVSSIRNRRVENFTQCQDCALRSMCRGGCLATVYKYTGTYSKPYCGFWNKFASMDYNSRNGRDSVEENTLHR